ncbi:tripartite tricarboxylate transporter substrate binding protein [uncultured Ramlibacter sp.]|uniref:Bug family tripartite tricarboxylate transporter substrate binding protein n=1 Tax=uncultured Ramlibacter sp. TaxID=260755 RepID=UPI00261D2DFD|nr:tripartite tricarboxylate transporter substrate-binding protein [uncultured Ramlibacter sp.]
MNLIKRKSLIALAAAALLPLGALAQAPWPAPGQTIKIIVPFPAGGASDQIGRIVAKALGDELKATVVVENRSGANGGVGAAVVAKAAPDGYTLLVGSIGVFAINAGLYSKLPYDPLKDFAPISVLVSTPNVLVVPANSKFNTAQELADFMKKNPGKLSYASSGAGSSDHLTAELYKKAIGGYAVHIPYRGGAPAMQDIIAGQADFMFSNLGPAMPFIKAGKMKALMLTAAKPATQLPDVPIAAKTGANIEVTSWQAFAAPAGTPPAIVQRLSQIAVKAMAAPDVKERMANQAFDIVANNPAEFSDFLKKEVARWKLAVKESGAGLD